MEIWCAGEETKANQPHLCIKTSISKFTLTAVSLHAIKEK